MEHSTDVRRHRDQHQDTDWMRWCAAFKAGVEDRLARRGPGMMENSRMTWRYAAYISGYLYGTDPGEHRRDLFDAAREAWA